MVAVSSAGREVSVPETTTLSPTAGSIAKRISCARTSLPGPGMWRATKSSTMPCTSSASAASGSFAPCESGPPNSAATRSKPRSSSTCSEVADMPGAASRRDKPTSAPPSSRLLTSTSLASGRRVRQPPDQAEPTPYSHPTSYRRPRAVTRAEQTFAEFHQIDTDLAQRGPVGARVKPDGMKRTVHCAYAALWMASFQPWRDGGGASDDGGRGRDGVVGTRGRKLRIPS